MIYPITFHGHFYDLMRELDTTIHLVPSYAFPLHDIAYNPNRTEFLVVWSERVDDEYLFKDIYGAFVDEETGQISKPFCIVSLPYDQEEPSVSFDGNNYLVVWKNVGEGRATEIHAALIDQNGNILIQDIVIRSHTPYRRNFKHPSVAFNGEHYLVVWSGEYYVPLSSLSRVRIIAGRLVDRNGNIIGNEDIFISPFDPSLNHLCNVTSDGNNFLVSWVGTHILKIRLVYGNGIPGPDIVHLATGLPDSGRTPQSVYGKAGDQKKYLVVWTDTQGTPERYDVYAALINPNNIINFEIYPIDTGTNPEEFPSCTFSPIHGHFLIIWEEKMSGRAYVLGRTMDFSGSLGPVKNISYIEAFSLWPTRIEFGTQYALSVWFRHSSYTISGVRVDGNLNRIDLHELLINQTINSQTVVRGTFNGENYFVVWEDNKRGTESPLGRRERGIYLTRVTPKGEILDIPPICIKDELNIIEFYPDIAFASQYFLVTYIIPCGFTYCIKGVLVDQQGNPIQEIYIDTAGYGALFCYPSVCASRSHFLCAYQFCRDELYYWTKVAIIEETNPSNIIHHIVEPELSRDPFNPPGIASDGEKFMVVYEFGREIVELRAVIVTPGSPPSQPISIGIGMEPAVAFGNGYYFVTWRIPGSVSKIMGRFYDTEGNPVGDAFLIYESPNIIRRPSVEFDGWEYLVSFHDLSDGKIKTVAVSLDGSLLGELPWIISGEHPAQRNASLTKGPGNQILATYEGLVEDPYRAFARFLEFFEVEEFAIAYNSNVNMHREPITDKIHLVYTSLGNAYYREGFVLENPIIGPERILWNKAFELGPAQSGNAAIFFDGDVHVVWSTGTQIYYRAKIGENWTPPYTFPPHIGFNLYPTITSSRSPVISGYIHIIYNNVKPYPLGTTLYEIYFPTGNPSNYTEIPIFGFFPSQQHIISSADFLGNLHLAFTWRDEIYYATRKINEPYWSVHGNVFPNNLGKNSTTPMTEVYGDSVFIVWTRYMEDGQYEVIRASRHVERPINRWMANNFSRTPGQPPLDPKIYQAPVNAWGIFTVWVDKGVSGSCDVFTRDPFDINRLVNLTQTNLHSIFPEAFAKFTLSSAILGLVWEEQENQPSPLYNIRSQIFKFLPTIPPYYTLTAGDTTPSIHITYRDSFIREWNYPVDIGYDSISARFYLDPVFEYDIEIFAYHEGKGEWREFVYFDGKPHRLIKYKPYKLEKVKIHIPKGFYKDGILNVSLKRIKGDYATLHKMIVYRYESEEVICAQMNESEDFESEVLTSSFKIRSNIVKDNIFIDFDTPIEKNTTVSIYDINGRMIKNVMIPQNTKTFVLNLDKGLHKGIYFIKIQNEKKLHKIVKIK